MPNFLDLSPMFSVLHYRGRDLLKTQTWFDNRTLPIKILLCASWKSHLSSHHLQDPAVCLASWSSRLRCSPCSLWLRLTLCVTRLWSHLLQRSPSNFHCEAAPRVWFLLFEVCFLTLHITYDAWSRCICLLLTASSLMDTEVLTDYRFGLSICLVFLLPRTMLSKSFLN